MTTIKDNLIELSLEELITMDIALDSKVRILAYTLGADKEHKLKAYAGGLVLNTRELDHVGVSASNLVILRLLNQILNN
tara:strand:+ start:308 stop:544 length:237 start_codon:yes stop_codon:yes gene_type:complete